MRPTVLKIARIKAGMKQKELAKAGGIGVTMLSRLENGATRPSLRTLQKLSSVLNVSLDDLAKDYELEQVAN